MKRLFYIFVFFFVSLSVMGAKIPSGTKLYLKPTGTWNNSGAWFAAYFFGDGEAWVKMEDKDGDGIFSCITPNSGKNYTNVIFVRMSSTNQSLSWDAKWNQTSNLTYDGSKNLYTITGWNGDQGKGSWSVASIKYLTEGTILYLNPTNIWTVDNARFAVNFYGDFGERWVSMEQADFNGVYRVRVPSGNWTKLIFVRMNGGNQTNNWNNKWNQTGNLSFDGTKNLYTISDVNGRGAWSVYTLPLNEKVTYYVAGTMNSWSNNTDQMTFVSTELGASYVYENLKKGECQFKITNGTWDWTKGHSDFDKNNSDVVSSSNNDGNVKFTLANDVAKMTIYFSLDYKISVKLAYNVVVNSGGNGTVSGGGTYNHNEDAELKATPNTGYHFVKWNDGNTENPRKVTVSKGATYTAEFAVNTYTITATAGDGGSVTGDGSYDYNKTATLTATADRGYKFIRWSDDNIDNPRKFTVTKDATYTAVFDKLCEYDELAEKTTYYVSASTIEVANKYENEKVEGVETVVDGVYSIIIPSTSVYDRLVLDDKTFNTSQITTQYYNGSEWLYCDIENVLNLSDEPQRGLYGIINFQKIISGENVNEWHWISLPYNVKISEIEGGVFGSDFIIQEYDTEARAKWENNIAAENESAWRMMEVGETLLAGKGYILAVDNEKSSYTLTFVSETDLNVVADEFDGNNINYSFNVAESANWHLIGTGLYGAADSFGGVDYVAVPQGDDYLYYNLSTDGLANINAYTAFFVQHEGDYSFSKVQPAQNAAPRRARDEEVVEQYYVNIVGMADTSHTAIFLAEDGSDDYVVGKDFLHLGASGASLQLYTLQGESTLSFNYLKREDRTVLVGGYVAQSGKYTISLDGNGEASSVLLYDMETGLVADLLSENYEFEAEKGILDGRFSVIISYAKGDGPATEVENDMTMGVVVVNCDGIARFEGLSIGESVVVYDVVGRCVTQFVAESDKADVMLISGVYVLYHNGETVKFVVNR